MAETRIDVQVEHKHRAAGREQKHPNTCPSCGSHYRDDELAAALYVCTQCGHHFPMPARARIEWLADPGSFVEEAADVRSADPLHFFDLRPYVERLAEAELNTGLGEAMVDRPRDARRPSARARGDGLRVHGRLDGERRRREVRRAPATRRSSTARRC